MAASIRPAKLGHDFAIASKDDVDDALHEMAWIAAEQEIRTAKARKQIEAIKTQTDESLFVEIDGKEVAFADRWKALNDAVFGWASAHLKEELPANKKTLKLSHGELKLRALAAAVAMLEGKSGDKVAFELANDAGLIAAADKALKKTLPVTDAKGEMLPDVDPIALSSIVRLIPTLDKKAIQELWVRRPEIREFLQTLSISVTTDEEQISINPAALQVATEE